MAAVALRSCCRGLSQILSNGGLAALSSKRLEGLLRCPLMAGTLGNVRVSYRGIYTRRRGCGSHRLRRPKIF